MFTMINPVSMCSVFLFNGNVCSTEMCFIYRIVFFIVFAEPASKPIPDIEKLRSDTEEFALKVKEFYYGKPVGHQPKQGASSVSEEDAKEVCVKHLELLFISVRSLFQNGRQRAEIAISLIFVMCTK